MKNFALLLTLALAILTWFLKRSDKKEQKADLEKKEIKDVVNSGSNSMLHNLIDRMRRNKNS